MATTRVRSEPPLVVIVGPTASGKTGLAVRLAKEFGGEIISADSRAIYKGLDIGTAKPTLIERGGVVHWGIDLVKPGERFTAADFKDYAQQKIIEIRARGRTPFLVGGTGLYVDAVLYDFQFPPLGNDIERRKELETMSLEALHAYCRKDNIALPENDKNRRYVINAILRNGYALKRQKHPVTNATIVGITTEKEILQKRIAQRTEQIFIPAMFDEARQAGEKYGWDNEAMTGNIYPLLQQYFADKLTLEQTKEKFRTLDWRLAKRQLTWLKRNEHITWLELEEAYTYLARQLRNSSRP